MLSHAAAQNMKRELVPILKSISLEQSGMGARFNRWCQLTRLETFHWPLVWRSNLVQIEAIHTLSSWFNSSFTVQLIVQLNLLAFQ